jgi:hypothetical protein
MRFRHIVTPQAVILLFLMVVKRKRCWAQFLTVYDLGKMGWD